MTPITKPKNKEELVEALLAVRRDLEAKGEIGQKPAPQPLVPTPSAPSESSTPSTEPVSVQPPTPPQAPAARAVPLRTAASAQASSKLEQNNAPAGMRPDPYREQIETGNTEQTPVPIPRAPLEPEVHRESEIDPALMSEEITEGLAELLAKWNLFEKSGIFGLGPSGMQHPDYEKIADLPVETVLAGQWEGADEATAKTIGEYVAGWTEEQGVAPYDGETFELYLRRVIASYLAAPAEETPAQAA